MSKNNPEAAIVLYMLLLRPVADAIITNENMVVALNTDGLSPVINAYSQRIDNTIIALIKLPLFHLQSH